MLILLYNGFIIRVLLLECFIFYSGNWCFCWFSREMALEGLFPDKDDSRSTSQNLDFKYPNLEDMLNYILKQQPKVLDSTDIREQHLLFPSKMYVAMIKFLLKCFESQLDQNNTLGRSSEFLSSVGILCSLLEHAMAWGSVELHATAFKASVTIGSYLPEVAHHVFFPHLLDKTNGQFFPILSLFYFRSILFSDDSITLCTENCMAETISGSCRFRYSWMCSTSTWHSLLFSFCHGVIWSYLWPTFLNWKK